MVDMIMCCLVRAVAYLNGREDRCVWSSDGMMTSRRKTKELLRKTCSVPLYPPQILHGLTQAQTRASMVRGH
jgi:hypothetical protein